MPAIEKTQQWVRKFEIGRETDDKKSRPHFMEWVKELPETLPKGAKSRIKTSDAGKVSKYLLWQGWQGFLVGLSVQDKSFGEIPQRILTAEIEDESGTVEIHLPFYNSYAGDLMKRLLDPNFDPKLQLRLTPYAMDKENGKGQRVGISCVSGVDMKLAGNASEFGNKPAAKHLEGMPPLEEYMSKGQTVLDNTKQTEWLWNQLLQKVVPKLSGLGGVDRPKVTTVPPPADYTPKTGSSAPDPRFPAIEFRNYENSAPDPDFDSLPF